MLKPFRDALILRQKVNFYINIISHKRILNYEGLRQRKQRKEIEVAFFGVKSIFVVFRLNFKIYSVDIVDLKLKERLIIIFNMPELV